MNKIKVKIGIVSDVVCPWCYIGKRRLEKAMRQSSDRLEFNIEYYPFELNPNLPDEGIDFKQYLSQKFGSEEKFMQLTAHVKKVAAGEGLDFRFDLQTTSPNTRNAHRIIMVARDEGRQAEVVEAFFRAYFTEGRDLSEAETLIDIATQAGLDEGKIGLLLSSNTGKLEIEMAEKELQEVGITSVPLFIIDDKIAISGAQSVDTFINAFEELALVKA